MKASFTSALRAISTWTDKLLCTRFSNLIWVPQNDLIYFSYGLDEYLLKRLAYQKKLKLVKDTHTPFRDMCGREKATFRIGKKWDGIHFQQHPIPYRIVWCDLKDFGQSRDPYGVFCFITVEHVVLLRRKKSGTRYARTIDKVKVPKVKADYKFYRRIELKLWKDSLIYTVSYS